MKVLKFCLLIVLIINIILTLIVFNNFTQKELIVSIESDLLQNKICPKYSEACIVHNKYLNFIFLRNNYTCHILYHEIGHIYYQNLNESINLPIFDSYNGKVVNSFF